MATSLTTEQYYNGTGSQTNFAFTFPYTKESDVKVEHPIGTVLTPKAGSTANDYEFLTATTIKFTTAPGSGTANVKIYRATNVDSAKAVFATGSTIRASDLNSSLEHVLFSRQDKIQTTDVTDQAITAAKIKNDTITAAQLATDSVGALELADNSVASANIINGSIVDADINASAAIAGSKLAASTSSVAGSMSAADKAKLDGIETGATADQTNAEIRAAVEAASDSNVFTDADHSKLNAIEANATADQTNAEIRAAVEAATDSNVFTDADHSKLNAIEANATADQTAAEIRTLVEAASDSNVFTDADHSKLNAIEASATADQTDAEIKTAYENNSNTNAYTDAEKSKLSGIEANATADQTNAEIRAAVEAASDSNVFTDADHSKLNAIEASATADQTAAEIKTAYESNADTNPLTDTEKAVIDGVTANTSEINMLDGATCSTAELNLLTGKSIVTSIAANATDSQLASAQAVNERIVELVTEVGGFVPIANEVSFPNTNPDVNDGAGTIVSIADAGGVVVNGSGVSTTGRTVGGSTVTINGIDSSLNNTTIAAGQGMLVETTTTLNTYTYHRLVVDEAGVANAKAAVDDFNNRYRVGSSNPTSSLDDGDLFFNTSTDKMLVYNSTGSSWDEVQSVGNFFINTISSSSGSPGTGGSATFNNSANRFTLSNAGTYAQQHIVSINGVIQKPNSGTSVPSEGFAIDGSDILFSSAPATGSDYFIITVGASVNIGAPSNNTVTSAMIVDGTITGGDIASDTITEDKLDIHAAPSGTNKFLGYTSNGLEWAVPPDTNTSVGGATGVDFNDNVKARWGTDNDIQIWHDNTGGGYSYIFNYAPQLLKIGSDQNIVLGKTSNENYFIAKPDNAVELYYDNSKKLSTASFGVQMEEDVQFSSPGDTNALTWDKSEYTLEFRDNVPATWGDGKDLKIYHSGSHSYLLNSGTGNLYLQDNDYVEIGRTDEAMLGCVGNGAVNLYYDGSKKFETKTAGVGVTGAINVSGNLELEDSTASNVGRIRMGNGDDFQIYHDGTNSNLINSTGDLYIQTGAAKGIYIRPNNGENGIILHPDGAVELYHNNALRFNTSSSGVDVTGELYLPDNTNIKIGNSGDLLIYSDGDYGNIKANTNDLFIRSNSDGDRAIAVRSGAAVELYYDNSKKFETYAGGCQMGGDLSFSDSQVANFGTGSDLQIWHNGSNAIIKNTTGDIQFMSDVFEWWDANGNERIIDARKDGAVELYYNNVKHFETTSIGCKISDNDTTSVLQFANSAGANGYVMAESTNIIGFKDNNPDWLVKGIKDGAVELYYNGSKKFETRSDGAEVFGDLRFGDNKDANFGNDADLKIYHDGSHSKLVNSTGDLHLASNNAVKILGGSDLAEVQAVFNDNGACELYHDNSKKVETTSGGINVTGAITVNGSALSSGLFESVARYSEQTDGSSGSFNSGDWRTRALNTEEYDPDGIGSLSSWQITLAAGTYYAQWRAPAYRAHRHVTRLWNVTDGSQIGDHGQAGFSPSGGDTANGYSHGAAWFTISASKAIRLEHRCQTSRGTNGFGVHGNVTPHTFAAIDIFKAS